MTTEGPSAPEAAGGGGRLGALLAGGAVLTAAGLVAIVWVDVILGAFAAIVGLTLLVIWAMARDWDRHPSYEEREAARARRRKEKWERGSAARDRDRARWEAHQARQARKSGR